MEASAFYEPLGGGRYRATVATQSPWDPKAQHGGPPAALVAHAVMKDHPREGVRIGRVAAEFLGPIPLDEITVTTRVARPGKKIEMLEVEIHGNGRVAVAARVWRIATNADEHLAQRAAELDTVPEIGPDAPGFSTVASMSTWGYGAATEWRYVRGAMGAIGSAAAWMRPRVPLVAGEPWAPVERVLVTADSANGISGELPMDGTWMFVPPSFSIALQREPVGEWMLLDAHTRLAPDGLGVCAFDVSDTGGVVGSGTQALFVERITR